MTMNGLMPPAVVGQQGGWALPPTHTPPPHMLPPPGPPPGIPPQGRPMPPNTHVQAKQPLSEIQCYSCEQFGHYASYCLVVLQAKFQAVAQHAMSMVPQQWGGHPGWTMPMGTTAGHHQGPPARRIMRKTPSIASSRQWA